jgi:hypothetical protein
MKRFVLTRTPEGWCLDGGQALFYSIQDAIDLIVEGLKLTTFHLEVIP